MFSSSLPLVVLLPILAHYFLFFSVGQEVQNILRLLREMSRIRQAFLAEHSEDNEEERVRVMDEIQGLLCEDHPRMP